MTMEIGRQRDSRRSEDRLREKEIYQQSEARLRLIIESAPYAMIIVNEEGQIVFSNSQTEKNFGYKREELLGQLIEILLPKDIHARHTHYRGEFNAHPATRAMGTGRDLFGVRKDGSQVPVEIGLTPIETPDGRQILASIVDITARKRMEMERKRLEQEVLHATELEQKRIGQELHDSLGQQLLGIAFLSDALKERLGQKSLPEAGDAEHISTLIQNVMTEARELSRELYAAELEAHGLCEALKQLLINIKATTNIHCQFVCDTPFVVSDKIIAGNLYRIAQEALHNARRHSLATEITLSVTSSETEFKMAIKDNGIGLPTAPPSTGMGIKTMQYRADFLGGSFQASSGKDGGTVISCAVPLKKDAFSP